MMDYDFSGYEPDALIGLFEALNKHLHPDEGQDMAQIRPLAEEVQALAARVDEMEREHDGTADRLDKLEDHYYNQFIGGLTDLYNQNLRSDGIGALKVKFGADFEPFGEYLKELLGEGGDIFGNVYDHLHSHWDDADFDPDDFVDNLIDELKDRMERMKGALGPKEPEVEMEITSEKGRKPVEANEVSLDEIKKIMRHPSVRGMAS